MILADDHGSKSMAVDTYAGWIDGVDLLLGPYASGLVRAVAPLVRDAGRILWNHGGSADDLAQRGTASLPAPASTYFEGIVDEAIERKVRRLIIVQGPGPFARYVANGAKTRGTERGIDSQTVTASTVETEDLDEAALQLDATRGFQHTTVAEIAKRAGLTERTFFRHFGDKREVLFAAADALQEALVSTVANAPDSLAPIEAVAAGLEAVGAELPDRETARQRQTIIAANPGLRERELITFAALSAALAEALRARGLRDPAAALAAEVGIAVFRIAFERWIDDTNDRDLPELIRESLDELGALSAADRRSPSASAQPRASRGVASAKAP